MLQRLRSLFVRFSHAKTIQSVSQPSREADIQCQILFLQKYGECYGQSRNLDHQTLKWIHHHHWPGNIRELDNYIHRLFLLNRKDATDKPTKSDKDDYFKDRRKTFDRRQTVDVDLPFKVAKNQMIDRFESDI